MIQDVSQKIHKALAEKMGMGEPISKQAIDSSDLPSPIRTYLLALLEREAERVAEGINNRRDVWIAESVDVRRARTAFAVAVTRNVQLPADRIAEVLRSTSDVVLRYLIRPSSTLQGTIFERAEQSLDVDEILERMRMFSAYPYFQEVLRHYFAEREIEHVEREKLDSVLHRIDRQMTSDFSAEEWSDILEPLYETLAVVPDYAEGVPADVLRIFFREKELGEMLMRMDRYGRGEIISRDELVAILTEAPVAPEEAPQPEPDLDEEPRSRPVDQPAETAAEPASEREMVPLWKQFQRAPGAPARESAAAPSAKDADVPMWQRFRQGASPKPSEPEHPIMKAAEATPMKPDQPMRTAPEPGGAIKSDEHTARTMRDEPVETPSDLDSVERRVLGDRGARSRRMFIRQLFSGSTDDYREALERIDQTSSWAEASRVIAKDVFRRYDINIYDEAAVGFTDMVEARFGESV